MTDVSTPIENLTDEQTKKFVSYLLLGRKDTEAARLAGFPQPRVAAVRLLQDPRVLEEIEKAVIGRLRGELAPKALNNLADILESKSASRTLKLGAAKAVLDRAGHVAPKAPDKVTDPVKALAEQSPEELHAFMAAAQNELASRARVVDGKAQVKRPARQRKAITLSESDAEAAGLLD